MGAELVNPATGEVVAADDVDALAEQYLAAKAARDGLRAFQNRVALALAGLAAGEARTRRVRGEEFEVAVEMPGDAFDQGALKRLWSRHPKLAPEFIAAATYRVKVAEYKKALNETGPPEFEEFKAGLIAANRGPQRLPEIKVKRLPKVNVEGSSDDEQP